MLTRLCDGCLERQPADLLTDVGGEVKVCPRCAMLMLLYTREAANPKEFQRGCLAPSKVNRRYREICLEYKKDPVATVQKYCPQELRESDILEGKITLTDADFAKLESGWDFVLLSPQDAEIFRPEPGKEIEARNGRKRIRRRIYAVREFSEKEGLKYRRGGFVACFVPEGE